MGNHAVDDVAPDAPDFSGAVGGSTTVTVAAFVTYVQDFLESVVIIEDVIVNLDDELEVGGVEKPGQDR